MQRSAVYPAANEWSDAKYMVETTMLWQKSFGWYIQTRLWKLSCNTPRSVAMLCLTFGFSWWYCFRRCVSITQIHIFTSNHEFVTFIFRIRIELKLKISRQNHSYFLYIIEYSFGSVTFFTLFIHLDFLRKRRKCVSKEQKQFNWIYFWIPL